MNCCDPTGSLCSKYVLNLTLQCFIGRPMVVESDRNMSLYWNEKSCYVRRTARDLFLNVRMKCFVNYRFAVYIERRSQWPRTLSRRSAAARLLGLWVRIPPGAWMFVCCECRVFSGRGLCDGLITRPEESYRLCCVVVCDLETSWMRRSWSTGGCSAKNKQTIYIEARSLKTVVTSFRNEAVL